MLSVKTLLILLTKLNRLGRTGFDISQPGV
jgi:hypothetical protein